MRWHSQVWVPLSGWVGAIHPLSAIVRLQWFGVAERAIR